VPLCLSGKKGLFGADSIYIIEQMEYIRFGNTGFKVSRLCLGTITYGKPAERWQWLLNEELYQPHLLLEYE
jgi:hypothetical protein